MVLGRLTCILVVTLLASCSAGPSCTPMLVPDRPSRKGPGQQDRRAVFEAGVKERIEIPSPGRLRTSSGRGKALLYRLDRNEKLDLLRRDGKVIRFRGGRAGFHWPRSPA